MHSTRAAVMEAGLEPAGVQTGLLTSSRGARQNCRHLPPPPGGAFGILSTARLRIMAAVGKSHSIGPRDGEKP